MSKIVKHPALRSRPIELSVFVEPGQEELWAAIGRIRAPGHVTAAEMARMSGASKGSAEIYLKRLVSHGIAVEGPSDTANQKVYQVPTWTTWP